jgi:hypothetical protein
MLAKASSRVLTGQLFLLIPKNEKTIRILPLDISAHRLALLIKNQEVGHKAMKNLRETTRLHQKELRKLEAMLAVRGCEARLAKAYLRTLMNKKKSDF